MIGARVVDALLARDEADRVRAELGGEAAVRLLGEHPQRPGVDAAAALLQHLERVVGLAGVRRAEVGDDATRAATRRCGSEISIAPSARFTAALTPAARARWWRSERLGRFARPRPCLRPPGME